MSFRLAKTASLRIKAAVWCSSLFLSLSIQQQQRFCQYLTRLSKNTTSTNRFVALESSYAILKILDKCSNIPESISSVFSAVLLARCNDKSIHVRSAALVLVGKWVASGDRQAQVSIDTITKLVMARSLDESPVCFTCVLSM